VQLTMGKNDTFCCEKRQELAKMPSSFLKVNSLNDSPRDEGLVANL